MLGLAGSAWVLWLPGYQLAGLCIDGEGGEVRLINWLAQLECSGIGLAGLRIDGEGGK